MKVRTEINQLELIEINEDSYARCDNRDGFKKMMAFYKHDKPVWAHRDYVVAEPARFDQKPRKNRKNRG